MSNTDQGSQFTSAAFTGVNDGPNALADAGSVSEDQSVTLDVLANDTEIDAGDVKTLISVSSTEVAPFVRTVWRLG